MQTEENEAMPQSRCPGCRQWVEDWDGFGMLYHAKPEGCGWCRHANLSGDSTGRTTCDFCGATVRIDDEGNVTAIAEREGK